MAYSGTCMTELRAGTGAQDGGCWMRKACGEAGGRQGAGVPWKVWAHGAELLRELLPRLEEGHLQTCRHTALTHRQGHTCLPVHTCTLGPVHILVTESLIHAGPVGHIARIPPDLGALLQYPRFLGAAEF